MQITNSVVCDASKGCIYKQIKPSLVGEHAFPLTGFVCWLAQVTGPYCTISDNKSSSNLTNWKYKPENNTAISKI